jgi:hypothetical protein
MNPNPLSVFRLIVPVVDAIGETLSTLFALKLSADEYHTIHAGTRLIRAGVRRDQTARASQAGVLECRNARPPSPALFGACALSHECRGHVDWSRTRMLLSDVRGEAIRRDVFAAEPTEGLAGRDVDALHCITSIGDCRLDVKRERPLHPGRQLGRAAAQEPTPETVSSQ